MSDIFREVDEDLRREQARRLWDRFGPYVIGLAVLIVLGTAGYRGWEYWQQSQANASGDRFLAALQLATDGKHAEAITALQAVADSSSGNYPVLARFRIAAEKAATGDNAGAVTAFDAIAADAGASADVRNMARLRAALLLVDTATLADLKARVGDLAATGNAWRQPAREMLGLVAWRSGDFATARTYYNDLVNDQEATQDVRQRASLMLTLIDAKLGTPPPAAATTAPAAPVPTTPAPQTP